MIKLSQLKEKSKVFLDNTFDQLLGVKEGAGMLFQPVLKALLLVFVFLAGLAFMLGAIFCICLIIAGWSALVAIPVAFIIGIFCADIPFSTIYLASFVAIFVINLLNTRFD